MKPILIGAAVGVLFSVVVNVALGHGLADAMEGALVCWGPLGAFIAWAWSTKVTVRAKPTAPPKDPTRYDPN